MMARKKICMGSRPIFPDATVTIWAPMVLSPALMAMMEQPKTMPTSTSDPAKLPSQTTTQFFRTLVQAKRLLAAPMTMRQLPVKSSAPATMTQMRPSEKQKPPRMLDAAKPSVGSAFTQVMNNAPLPMSIPAMSASTMVRPTSIWVFARPTASAFCSSAVPDRQSGLIAFISSGCNSAMRLSSCFVLRPVPTRQLTSCTHFLSVYRTGFYMSYHERD